MTQTHRNTTLPHAYPRRVLVAVTGLSPQILTETLYALTSRQSPAFIPTEAHLITTRLGAEHARLNLLSDEPGWFHRLIKDHTLPPIQFDSQHIHVLRNAQGAALDDIRTEADNVCAADLITERIRTFTADQDSALHVSIAGGRKTMGFYLGYALSIFGRPQDRLSHVLVSAPFESHPQFYYPTPYERVIHTAGNPAVAVDCRNAEITLAEIPFVRLRGGLDDRLLSGHKTYSETIAAAQHALRTTELIVDLQSGRICAGGIVFKPAPANLAMLAVFVRRAMDGQKPIAAPKKGVPDAAWASRYLKEYRSVRNHPLADHDNTERALRNGMNGEFFSSRLSALHKELRKHLGPAAAAPYQIDGGESRPHRYALKLAPPAVRFGRVEEDNQEENNRD